MNEKTLNVSRWNLTDLFASPSDPRLEAAFSELEEKTATFEARRTKLRPDFPEGEFHAVLAQLEEINLLITRLYSFSGLWFAEDTQNQAAQSLAARIEQFSADLSNRILFFNIWWKDLDDQNAARLMAGSGDYRYWLEEMRHYKPHTLSEAEEKIINIKNVTGQSAQEMLYESITNRYSFHMEINGQTQELTRGEIMVYARHQDPSLRAKAYQEMYRVYGQDGPILGQMYQNLVRDWRNEQIGLRQFSSPIAARNLANDLPDEVVNTLLEVSQRNTSIFQRFFQLKARWLGIDKLRRYDIYAPLSGSEKNYSFDQAAKMVFDCYRKFDPHLENLAQQVFDSQHVDSEVRKGKRGGAFCWTATPDLAPWVLLNFQGKADDIATMAHELGHALHSLLANQHSAFTHHACLPLAETASTFGEMLLLDHLLSQETSAEVRRDMLFRQMDDAYATIQRQAFFSLFERQAHEMVQKGASVDELTEAYLANLKAQFGDSVEISDEFRWEWVSIPHIYSVPFYVYAYSFGQLLVLALYQQYKAEAEAFKPRYLRLLSAGGSKSPIEILTGAGFDIRQDTFWQGGFDVLDGLVRQLEAMPVRP
jgi:oligoendopeptidase F